MPKIKPLTEKPVARFRVYPSPKQSYYFIIHVWKNRTQMHRQKGRSRNKYEACCIPQEWKYRNKLDPQIGELNFHLNCLDEWIISHEMTHAAVAWAKKVKLDTDFIRGQNKFDDPKIAKRHGSINIDSPEELFCYAQSNLVLAFNARIKKHLSKIK